MNENGELIAYCFTASSAFNHRKELHINIENNRKFLKQPPYSFLHADNCCLVASQYAEVHPSLGVNLKKMEMLNLPGESKEIFIVSNASDAEMQLRILSNLRNQDKLVAISIQTSDVKVRVPLEVEGHGTRRRLDHAVRIEKKIELIQFGTALMEDDKAKCNFF